MHSKVKGKKAAAVASTATNSSCPQQRVASEALKADTGVAENNKLSAVTTSVSDDKSSPLLQAANTDVAGRPAAEEGASVTQQTDPTTVTLTNKSTGQQVILISKG